jgi:putative Holliday junction resolvase
MRVVGLDFGTKRIGVAVSDPSGTIARPLAMIRADTGNAIDRVAAIIGDLGREEPAPEMIVLGLPLRLDGTPHPMAGRVRDFGRALAVRLRIPVVYQDERLSSREAEGRLAERHRSWQSRKVLLDAASAAVLLQDYLDRKSPLPPDAGRSEPELPDR